MSDCLICLNNKKKNIICNHCKEVTCKKCLIEYKKFECCNCNTSYKEIDIKEIFNIEKIFDNYVYYYIYINYFFSDKIQNIINEYYSKLENQKILRFGYIKKDLNLDNNKKIIKKCFNNNCKGVFYDSNCTLCSLKICLKCEEKFHGNENCNEKILKNLQGIKEECKKCPFCFTYIYKTEGCNIMKCTNCGVSFIWGDLRIIDKKHNNDHYTNILNKDLNKDFLNHFVNNKFVFNNKKSHNLLDFNFLKKKNFIPEKFKDTFIKLYKELKNKLKNIKKYEILYLLDIEKILKENVENSIDDLFYTVNFNNCKKLYIENKKYNFILKLFEELNFDSNNNIRFDEDKVKNYIDNFKKNNILLDNFTYSFIDNQISIFTDKKEIVKKFIIYKKKEYLKNKKIKLLDEEQITHATEIFDKLVNYNSCLNSSYAGSGKTYISLYIAYKLNIKNLIIISPNIMFSKWNEIIQRYNYKYKFDYLLMTYSEIYNKNFEINNNLFKKINLSQIKSTINISDYLLNFINNETMFIIDEIHNCKKNSSITNKFIKTLSSKIIKNKGYVLGLSATPLEKNNDIKNILEKLSSIKNYNNKKKYNSINNKLNKKKINEDKDDENVYKTEEESEEESEEEIKEETEYNDLPQTSSSALQRLNENNFNGFEKREKFEKIVDNITFNNKKNRRIFLSVLNVKPSIKKENYIKKIVNLLENLFLKYNLDNDFIIKKIKELNKENIDYNLHSNIVLIVDEDKTEEYFNNIEKYYYFDTKKFNETNIKILNSIKNVYLKNSLLDYLDRSEIKNLNIDIKEFNYIEELSFRICLMFNLKKNFISSSLLKFIYILYIYKFTLDDIYFLINLSFENIYKILLNIIFETINFGIQTTYQNNLENLKKLKYLSFSLNEEEKDTLNYAFTNIDIKTKDTININNLNFISLVNKGIEQTETVYIKHIFNYINIIHSFNKYKIVIAVSYTNTILDLSELFKKENVEFSIINGSVKNKNSIIEKFQNDNLDLLIVNISSLNCGLDLDDKKGNKERLIFIIPNFNFTNLIQFMFRFKRKDSLSEPNIYIINNHIHILNSLLKKYKDLINFNFNIPSLENIETEEDFEMIENLLIE